MKKEKNNIILTAYIDEKLNQCVHTIRQNIKDGRYPINDWDSFVETAILVFSKLLDNKITPSEFNLFIERNKQEEDICEA